MQHPAFLPRNTYSNAYFIYFPSTHTSFVCSRWWDFFLHSVACCFKRLTTLLGLEQERDLHSPLFVADRLLAYIGTIVLAGRRSLRERERKRLRVAGCNFTEHVQTCNGNRERERVAAPTGRQISTFFGFVWSLSAEAALFLYSPTLSPFGNYGTENRKNAIF